MTTHNGAPLAAATRRRSQQTRERAVAALRELDASGTAVTFTSVASVAEVSRSWLYRQSDLRDEIERLRSSPGAIASPQPSGHQLILSDDASKPATTTFGASRPRTSNSENKSLVIMATSAPTGSHERPSTTCPRHAEPIAQRFPTSRSR